MFADSDFSRFAVWLKDDLGSAEQQVWWSWLKLMVCYLTEVKRPLAERFSLN
jgi:hypothetical protein